MHTRRGILITTATMLIATTVGISISVGTSAGMKLWAADAPEGPIDLNVLYIGNVEKPRAAAFEKLLREHFASVRLADRETFDPAAVGDADVVLLDWSQRDIDVMGIASLESPLGPREQWTTPTVLLGSAGLLIATPWETNGSYG